MRGGGKPFILPHFEFLALDLHRVGWVRFLDVRDLRTPTFEFQVPLEGPVSPSWLDAVVTQGTALILSYDDVFVAERAFESAGIVAEQAFYDLSEKGLVGMMGLAIYQYSAGPSLHHPRFAAD